MKVLETYIVYITINGKFDNPKHKVYNLLYFCAGNRWILHDTRSIPNDWYNINEITEEKALTLIDKTLFNERRFKNVD